MEWKNLLILVFVFAVSLSACDDYYELGTGEEGVTGTEGLKMDFIPGTTPSRISVDENYNMQLRIENKGALDIEEGYLDIVFDSQLLELKNREDVDTFELRGGGVTYRGEDKVTEVRMRSRELPIQNVDQRDTTIRFNACYEYGTRFEGTMCIDTDLRSGSADKPCIMSPISGGKGQGAPVVVNRVEPRASTGSTGVNVNFDIYIRDSARGRVLTPGASERVCKDEISSDDFEVIDITEIVVSSYRLSEGKIKCDSHTAYPNQFDLSHRRGHITCRITEEIPFDRGTFTTPIIIHMDYGYLQTMEHSLAIVSR